MFHQMKQPPAPPTHYFIINFHTSSIQSPNPIFFHQILLQNHWSIKHRRYQHTFDVKKQILSILIGWFFAFVMGFYVSFIELCHGKPRQLTTEIYFGSILPRKTSVVKCRELLVKKFSQRKKGSYNQFFKFYCSLFFLF